MVDLVKGAYYSIRTLFSVGKNVKNKLEKKYDTFVILKRNNVAHLEDNFESVYFHALFSISETKPNELIKLFALKEVVKAFEEEYSENNTNEFWRAFEHNLHTNSKVRALKKQVVDINREIEDFKREFKKTVNQTRKPKEKEDSDRLEKIEGTVAQALGLSLQDELKFATDLMESYNYEQALKYLENLRKNKWGLASSEIRYKILANIGSCKLNTNDEDGANDFIASLEFSPNNTKALSFAALGYSIKNNKDKVKELAEKALKIDITNPLGWSCLIEITDTENALNTIISQVPSQLNNNSTISFAIHRFYKRIGNTRVEEEYLRKIIQNDPKPTPEYTVALGFFIQEQLTKSMDLLIGQISNENKKKLNESINLISEAIDKIKDSDLIKYRWWWYTNRAILKQINNDYPSALIDLREAYKLSQNNFDMMVFLVQNLIHAELFPEALDIFNRLKKVKPEDENNDIGIAHCLIGLNRQSEAINLLKATLNETKKDVVKTTIISTLIRAHTDIGDFDIAAGLVKELLALKADDISTHLDAKYFYESKGDYVNATTSILKTYELIKEGKVTHFLNLTDIASTLLKYNEYAKAIEIYLKFVNTSINSRYIEQLVRAYLLNHNLDKAFEIIKGLKSLYGLTPSLVETEIYLYEAIGSIDEAINICKEYLITNPNNQDILARLVYLYSRKGDMENIKENISLIRDFTLFNFDVGFKFAYILFSIGETEKALNTAWQVRSKNYSNGEAHKAFIQLGVHLRIDENIINNLPEVKENTAVRLKDSNGEIFTYTLISNKDIHEDRGELSSNSETGKLLLGKKVGDTVSIGNSKSYSITSIVHKFLQAQTDSFLLLEKKFPGVKGLEFHKMKGDGNEPAKEDLKEITDLLDQKHEFSESILDKYRQGLLPLGFLASFNGQNPIEIWGGVIKEGIGMFAYSSTSNEYDIASDKLTNDARVLIDITSILTLDRLKLLEKIKESTIKFCISFSTIDVIKNEIERLKSYGSEGLLTIFKRGTTYYKSFNDKETIDRTINSLGTLLAWIEVNCTILPCQKILTIEPAEKDLRYKTFGQSFFESILTAQEKNILFLSDDGVLRSVANIEYQVNGISTSLLLLYLLNQGVLSEKEYTDKLFMLHILNYKGTIINHEVLWRAIEEAKFSLSEPFITIASLLALIPSQQEANVARLVTEFLYKLTLGTAVKINQDLICNSVLQYAIKNSTSNYFNIQIQFITDKFRFLPLDSDRIINNFIACWNANKS